MKLFRRIVVGSFVLIVLAGCASDSPFATEYAGAPPQTPEQIATGRQLGEGRAESTAKKISDKLKERFVQQGWIK